MKTKVVNIGTPGPLRERDALYDLNNDGQLSKLETLLRSYDTTAPFGNFSIAEVKAIVTDVQTSEKKVKSLKQILLVMTLFILLLLGLNFGLTYSVVEMSKETETDSSLGTQFVKGTTTPVANAQVETGLSLAYIPFLDPSVIRTIKQVSIEVSAGTNLYLTISSIEVVEHKSFEMITTEGHVLTVTNPYNGTFTQSDSLEIVQFCPMCAACAAINVAPGELTAESKAAFHDYSDEVQTKYGNAGYCPTVLADQAHRRRMLLHSGDGNGDFNSFNGRNLLNYHTDALAEVGKSKNWMDEIRGYCGWGMNSQSKKRCIMDPARTGDGKPYFGSKSYIAECAEWFSQSTYSNPLMEKMGGDYTTFMDGIMAKGNMKASSSGTCKLQGVGAACGEDGNMLPEPTCCCYASGDPDHCRWTYDNGAELNKHKKYVFELCTASAKYGDTKWFQDYKNNDGWTEDMCDAIANNFYDKSCTNGLVKDNAC